MLPKKKRVTKSTFQTVMDKGSISSGSFFVFRYIKDTPNLSLAVTVPKKLAKKATKRNFLRRRGYNILRNIDINECWGIFFYKKEGLKADISDLKNDISLILKKTKTLKNG